MNPGLAMIDAVTNAMDKRKTDMRDPVNVAEAKYDRDNEKAIDLYNYVHKQVMDDLHSFDFVTLARAIAEADQEIRNAVYDALTEKHKNDFYEICIRTWADFETQRRITFRLYD